MAICHLALIVTHLNYVKRFRQCSTYHLFYPSDSHSIERDMDTFLGFTDDVPFVSKTEQELLTTTMLFQLRETKNF